MVKYWRRSSNRVIPVGEKALIRSRLFQLTLEANKQLNAQNAIAIARIARIDFPSQWPTLFDDIAQLINAASAAQNLVQLSNLLNILKELVKGFSVTRFGAARNGFQTAASGIVQLVGGIYVAISQTWMAQKDNLNDHLALMEVGYLALKVTGKVLAEGYERVHQDPQAAEIFQKITQHFQGYVLVYNSHQSDILAKHIKGLGKIFTHLFERQPVSFVLLPGALSVVQMYMSIMQEKAQVVQSVGSEDDEASNNTTEEVAEFWERTVVQGLKLFSELINHAYRKGSTSIRYRTVADREDAHRAHTLLESDLFNEQNIRGMLGLLLNHYLKLTPRDLESWKSEPEEWIAEEMKENWDYQGRSCSQKVLVDLLTNFKSIVSPILVEFIQSASSGNDILLQDVAYNVFALASSAPFENVSFDDMLVNVFLPRGYEKNQGGNENLKLVRRRIAIIISQWVSVQSTDASRVKIYEYLLFCLNPEDPLNDIVIRLEACNALRFTVDEWSTKVSDFLPFLSSFLNLLFPLIVNTLTSVESKQLVLQVISVIIERVQKKITPFTGMILQALPALWDESESHHQMRCIILQTLASLVSASGEGSTETYAISVPMLKASIDPASPISTFLFEDALFMWQALVESAPNGNQDVLELLPALVSIIGERTENLPVELKLLESYTLLSPESVANLAYRLFEIFNRYIPALAHESLTWINTVLSLLAAQLPLAAYAKPLYETGLLQTLVAVLAADVSPIQNVEILCFFSRMVCRDPAAFVQMVDAVELPPPALVAEIKKNSKSGAGDADDTDESAYSQAAGASAAGPKSGKKQFSSVLDLVMHEWTSRFDNMGHPRERKLNVIGLASVLRTGRPETVAYLEEVFVIWQQLIDETAETDVGDSEIYYAYTEYTNPNECLVQTSAGRSTASLTPEQLQELREGEENYSPELKRKRKLFDVDPVHCVVLKKYLQESLFAFQSTSPNHANALKALDPGLLQTLSIALGLS